MLFMRKQLVWGLIAAGVIVTAVVIAVSILSAPAKSISEPLRAIPLDAGMVIKVNSLASVNKSLKISPLWGELRKFKGIARLDSLMVHIDSIAQAEGGLSSLFEKGELFLSLHSVGKNETHLLVTARLAKSVSFNDIDALLKKHTLGLYRLSDRNYNGTMVIQLVRNERVELSYAHSKGVIVISTSPMLTERAIKQLVNNASLLTSRGFTEIQKTAGSKVDANVFVAHEHFPVLFAKQVEANYAKSLLNLKDLATWTELDLTLKPHAIFLNGFTQVPDTTSSFLRWMVRQKPVSMGVHEVLPAQTAFFISLGITSLDQYMQDYRRYLDKSGELRTYKKNTEAIARAFAIEPVSFYASFFKNELTVAYIPFSKDATQNWFTIVGTKGRSSTQYEMLSLLDGVARRNGVPVQSMERSYRIDRDKQITIYEFPASRFHSAMFGSLFGHCSDQYFTLIDSYMVFGPSPEALMQFALAQVHNRRLENLPQFRDFMQVLSQESNFTFYLNPQQGHFAYSHFLAPAFAQTLIKGFESAAGVEGVALQLSGGKQMVFNNICVRYGEGTSAPPPGNGPQTVWETQLDTVIRGKPSLVLNHNSRNREVFVQDHNNSIYLINDAGRVLWKVRLAEPIMGEVQQVDLFKNGKLQLLFNTQTGIHAIDRNGKYVEGFPIRLPSLATSPVAVFDYERTRDYRFFVALDDRRIVAYERTGKPLTGWEFGRTERLVAKPIQHFRVGGLDFIAATDPNRLYLLDRKGKERVTLLRHFPPSRNGNLVVEEASNRTPPRFVTTDSLGVVRFIYLDGRVDDKVVSNFTPNHVFDYQDVDGDGRKDFIFMDRNQLRVLNAEGKELFSSKFSAPPIPSVIYFNFGGRDRKLGVVAPSQELIYLINGDGTVYSNFPLTGKTLFSIGQFASTKTRFNLIVGSKTGSILNYAVQ